MASPKSKTEKLKKEKALKAQICFRNILDNPDVPSSAAGAAGDYRNFIIPTAWPSPLSHTTAPFLRICLTQLKNVFGSIVLSSLVLTFNQTNPRKKAQTRNRPEKQACSVYCPLWFLLPSHYWAVDFCVNHLHFYLFRALCGFLSPHNFRTLTISRHDQVKWTVQSGMGPLIPFLGPIHFDSSQFIRKSPWTRQKQAT